VLSPADIRERLNQVFAEGQPRHRSYLVALYGQGDEGRVTTQAAGEFEVRPVKSELELRKLVPDAGEGEPRVVFLVPWSGSLPIDLGSMFAAGGRILSLGRSLRLRRLFGATEVEGSAVDSPLTAYLLAEASRTSVPFGGGRLTLDAMWTAWLAADYGLATSGTFSLEELLAWATTNPRGPSFREATAEHAALRAELEAWLLRKLGPAGPATWKAWEGGQGDLALAYGAVLDGLAAGPDAERPEVQMWQHLKLRELGAKDDASADNLARALALAANGALRQLAVRDPSRIASLLDRAERLVDVDRVRAALIASRWMPSAWGLRIDRLGEALEAAAKAPDEAAYRTCASRWASLSLHQFGHEERQRVTLERAEMAVRLVGWLARRSDRHVAQGASAHAEVERLGRWYASEGGFVDWARRYARGTAASGLGRGANAVVEAVDAARTELDRAFARALPAWLDAGKPSTAVVPIEKAAEHFAVKFAAERPERRVLVLLMDGMAWAQAVEILRSLRAWGPVAWAARTMRLGNEQGVIPVLAHLPTVTEISRAAFFAGKRMMPGKPEPTDRDIDRWAENALVRKLLPDGEVPRLLLRAEGHTRSGAAAPEALQLVRDPRQRVVAVVVNAIDSSLKGDPQTRHAWTVDTIQPLRDLLDTAFEAGRVVLLASDHGHVPADRLESVGSPPDAKSRWRVWKDPAEAIAEYEVAFTKAQTWAPPGAHGIVCLADDAHRYGAAPHAGEHGGATLAEVMAPFMLIGPERPNVETNEPDPELTVAPFEAPSWWFPTAVADEAASPRRAAPAASAAAATRKPASVPPPKKSQQLALPELAPKVVHPLRAALEASELFKSRAIADAERKQLLDAVGFLLDREVPRVPIEVFAQAIRTFPARAPGVVARLSEKLNVDGFGLLTYDPGTQLVKLEVDQLIQIYGLTP
jgi:hypothetical protein